MKEINFSFICAHLSEARKERNFIMEERNTLLIVDDVMINRELLKDIFEEGEYKLLEAADGEEAIEILEKNKEKIALIFLDLVMPKKNGLEVMHYMSLNNMIHTIPVIMITGEATVESDVKAYELGAADIIYKPFEPAVVTRRAKNIIELYKHRTFMEKELEARNQELLESKKQIENSNTFLINALSSVVEFRSLESGEHIQRVKKFTEIMLRHWRALYGEKQFSNEQIELIVNASALHDIGKIAIPDNILLKPGKLTDEEYAEMKKHTIYGCQMLEKFKQEENEFYRYCYDICRYHHERYDGRGYPDGLKGDDIPIWAQVVAIVDVYDALVSKRVYKPSFSIEETFRMIKDGECGTFSPKLLKCFDDAKEDFVKNTTKEQMGEEA